MDRFNIRLQTKRPRSRSGHQRILLFNLRRSVGFDYCRR
uniref:Uncharacterized protein n=1 Tax=Romanomermis culicivorax TaxID=13658 RepID=A0A915K0U5_ROMCU